MERSGMKRKLHAFVLWVWIAGLLSACTPPVLQPESLTPSPGILVTITPLAPQPSPTQPGATPTETEAMTTSQPAPPSYDPAMEPLVQIARQDLAERLGIAVDEIEVLEAQGVVWGDTSMGCPHPDMGYLQVPQDGALIRLSVGNREYNYHSGGNRPPFLCETSLPDKSTPSLDEDIPTPPSSGDD
jgi:hypothetical protein